MENNCYNKMLRFARKLVSWLIDLAYCPYQAEILEIMLTVNDFLQMVFQ